MSAAYDITANLNFQKVIGLESVLEQAKAKVAATPLHVPLKISQDSIRAIDAMNAKLAGMQAPVGLTKSFDDINTRLASLRTAVATVNATKEIVPASAGASMVEVAKQTNTATSAIESFGLQSGVALRRFAAFVASAGSVMLFTKALREGFGQALEFERSMIRITQVSGETPDAIRDINQEVTRLSTSLGVSSAELAEVAVTLKQAGLTAGDTKKALEAIAQASLAPSFGSMKEITEGTIAVLQQFDSAVGNLPKNLGAMNAVAAQFAVESSDLVEALRRSGGAFKATGGNLNELLGLFTSVRATTRESAESISTGLRTIFSRLQRNDTVEALKDMGIHLRYTTQEAERLGNIDMAGQFVGGYEAIRRISEGLRSLRQTDPRYASIVEQLGGSRQLSRVLPLITENAEAAKAVNVAAAGQISTQIAAEQAQKGLLQRTSAVKEEFLALFRTLTESKGFQNFAQTALELASGLGKVLEFARPLIPLLTTMASISLARLVIGGAGKFLSNVTHGPFDRRTTDGPSTPPIPRRFSRGGVVPGHGHTDSVPALLQPNEFVIRADSARKIGYDTLDQWNRGNFVAPESQRFAQGGPVRLMWGGSSPLKARRRSIGEATMLGDLDASRDSRADLLRRGLVGTGAHQFIPLNARFLGHGLSAAAWGSGSTVYRVQPYIGQRPFENEKQYYHPALFKHERPNTPSVVQAKASAMLGDVLVEQLPYVASIAEQRGAHSNYPLSRLPGAGYDPAGDKFIQGDYKLYLKLLKQLRREGYRYTDYSIKNIGFMGKQPVIIDPGSLTRITEAATRIGFAPNARGGLKTDSTLDNMLLQNQFSGNEITAPPLPLPFQGTTSLRFAFGGSVFGRLRAGFTRAKEWAADKPWFPTNTIAGLTSGTLAGALMGQTVVGGVVGAASGFLRDVQTGYPDRLKTWWGGAPPKERVSQGVEQRHQHLESFHATMQSLREHLGVEDVLRHDYSQADAKAVSLRDQAVYFAGKAGLSSAVKALSPVPPAPVPPVPKRPDDDLVLEDDGPRRGKRARILDNVSQLLARGMPPDEVQAFLQTKYDLAASTARSYLNKTLSRKIIWHAQEMSDRGQDRDSIQNALMAKYDLNKSTASRYLKRAGFAMGGWTNQAAPVRRATGSPGPERNVFRKQYISDGFIVEGRKSPFAREGFRTVVAGRRGQNESYDNPIFLDTFRAIAKSTGIQAEDIADAVLLMDSDAFGSNALGRYFRHPIFGPKKFERIAAIYMKAIQKAGKQVTPTAGGPSSISLLARRVLGHELGHAAYDTIGAKISGIPLSSGVDTSNAIPKSYIDLGRRYSESIYGPTRPGYTDEEIPHEGLADLFSNYSLANTHFRTKNFAREFESTVLRDAHKMGLTRKRFSTGGSATREIPALLMPGEYVLNAEATSRIGSANLHRANTQGKVHRYHTGGLVGPNGPVRLATGSSEPVKARGDLEPMNLLDPRLKNQIPEIKAKALEYAEKFGMFFESVEQMVSTTNKNLQKYLGSLKFGSQGGRILREKDVAFQQDSAKTEQPAPETKASKKGKPGRDLVTEKYMALPEDRQKLYDEYLERPFYKELVGGKDPLVERRVQLNLLSAAKKHNPIDPETGEPRKFNPRAFLLRTAGEAEAEVKRRNRPRDFTYTRIDRMYEKLTPEQKDAYIRHQSKAEEVSKFDDKVDPRSFRASRVELLGMIGRGEHLAEGFDPTERLREAATKALRGQNYQRYGERGQPLRGDDLIPMMNRNSTRALALRVAKSYGGDFNKEATLDELLEFIRVEAAKKKSAERAVKAQPAEVDPAVKAQPAEVDQAVKAQPAKVAAPKKRGQKSDATAADPAVSTRAAPQTDKAYALARELYLQGKSRSEVAAAISAATGYQRKAAADVARYTDPNLVVPATDPGAKVQGRSDFLAGRAASLLTSGLDDKAVKAKLVADHNIDHNTARKMVDVAKRVGQFKVAADSAVKRISLPIVAAPPQAVASIVPPTLVAASPPKTQPAGGGGISVNSLRASLLTGGPTKPPKVPPVATSDDGGLPPNLFKDFSKTAIQANLLKATLQSVVTLMNQRQSSVTFRHPEPPPVYTLAPDRPKRQRRNRETWEDSGESENVLHIAIPSERRPGRRADNEFASTKEDKVRRGKRYRIGEKPETLGLPEPEAGFGPSTGEVTYKQLFKKKYQSLLKDQDPLDNRPKRIIKEEARRKAEQELESKFLEAEQAAIFHRGGVSREEAFGAARDNFQSFRAGKDKAHIDVNQNFVASRTTYRGFPGETPPSIPSIPSQGAPPSGAGGGGSGKPPTFSFLPPGETPPPSKDPPMVKYRDLVKEEANLLFRERVRGLGPLAPETRKDMRKQAREDAKATIDAKILAEETKAQRELDPATSNQEADKFGQRVLKSVRKQNLNVVKLDDGQLVSEGTRARQSVNLKGPFPAYSGELLDFASLVREETERLYQGKIAGGGALSTKTQRRLRKESDKEARTKIGGDLLEREVLSLQKLNPDAEESELNQKALERLVKVTRGNGKIFRGKDGTPGLTKETADELRDAKLSVPALGQRFNFQDIMNRQVNEMLDQVTKASGGKLSRQSQEEYRAKFAGEFREQFRQDLIAREKVNLRRTLPKVGDAEIDRIAEERADDVESGKTKLRGKNGKYISDTTFHDLKKDSPDGKVKILNPAAEVVGPQPPPGLRQGYKGGAFDYGDIVNFEAQRRYEARIKGLGPLSDASKEVYKEEAMRAAKQRLDRQLIEQTARAIQGTQKGISGQEAILKAHQELDKAIRGETKVHRDLTGTMLVAEKAFKDLGGAPLPNQALFGPLGRLSGSRRKIFDYLQDNFGIGPGGGGPPGAPTPGRPAGGKFLEGTNEFLNSGKFTALTIGLPLLAGGIDSLGGTAEAAASRGERGGLGNLFSRYTGAKATSSGLQGLVIGATAGASLGGAYGLAAGPGAAVAAPVLAISGAIVGGLSGFVQALREAEADIRDVRINRALTDFSERLTVVQNYGAGEGGGNASIDALHRLDTFIEENAQRAERQHTGILGRDYRAESETRTRGLREGLGGQLPAMVQSLNVYAESLARPSRVPGQGQAEEFQGSGPPRRTIEQMMEELTNGRGGLNRRLIATIADIRQTSQSEVRRDLARVFRESSRVAEVETTSQQNRIGEERNIGVFNRLTLSVQSAADAMAPLQRQALALGEAMGSIPISLGEERLNQLGRIDNGPLEPLRMLRLLGGEQGSHIEEIGRASQLMSQVLPNILTEVASRRGLPDADISTNVRQSLTTAVGGEGSLREQPQLRHAINSILETLDQEVLKHGEGRFSLSVQSGVSELSQRLLARFNQPVFNARQPLGDIRNALNGWGEQINRILQRQRGVRESEDQAATARVQRTRTEADFEDTRLLATPGTTVRQLPLERLQEDFLQRQQSLTGIPGQEALNPTLIRELIERNDREIQEKTRRREEDLRRNPNDIQGFERATTELDRLRIRSQDLTKALGNLADSTKRNAALNERLNQINNDRQSRISYSTSFLTASPEQRSEMNRGFIILRSVLEGARRSGLRPEQANLHGLTADQQASAINAGRQLGNARLPEFGGLDASTIINNLVQNTTGFHLDQNDTNEEQKLQRDVLENMVKAEKALGESARAIGTSTTTLMDNLRDQMKSFFETMNRNALESRRAEARDRITTAEVRLARLQERESQRSILESVGIRNDRGVSRALPQVGNIASFFETRDRLNDFRAQSRRLNKFVQTEQNPLRWAIDDNLNDDGTLRVDQTSLLTGNGPSPRMIARLRGFFNDTSNPMLDGLDAGQRRNIVTRFEQMIQRSHGRLAESPDAGRWMRGYLQEATSDELTGRALPGATTTTTVQQLLTTQRGLSSQLQGAGFSNLDTFQGNPDELARAIRNFSNIPNGFARLPEEIRETNEELQRWRNTLRETRLGQPVVPNTAASTVGLGLAGGFEALAGVSAGLAGGGLVSGPGTSTSDSVPAFAGSRAYALSNGEFVIRAQQVAANRGLVEHINRSSGPVRLAEGGPVDIFQQALNLQGSFLRRTSPLLERRRRTERSLDAMGEFANWNPNGLQWRLQPRDGGDQVFELLRLRQELRRLPTEAQSQIAGQQLAWTAFQTATSNSEVDSLRRRQNLARTNNPFAAFGLSRADSGSGIRGSLIGDRQVAHSDILRRNVGFDSFNRDNVVAGFASGGLVGGSGSPTADDRWIRASSGEFVVNADATRKNLGTLASINAGNATSPTQSPVIGQMDFSPFLGGVQTFEQAASSLSTAFGRFETAATELARALTNFPAKLEVAGKQEVTVVLNGGEMLSRITPEIREMVEEQITDKLRNVFQKHLPDANVDL